MAYTSGRKEEIFFMFTNDMFNYVENPKESTKHLELISIKSEVAGYR